MATSPSIRRRHLSDILAAVFGYCEERNQSVWNEAVRSAAKLALEKPTLVVHMGMSVLVDGERIVPVDLESHFEARLSRRKVRAVRLSAEQRKEILYRAREIRDFLRQVSAGCPRVSPIEIRAPFYHSIRNLAEAEYNLRRDSPSMWDSLRQDVCKRLRISIGRDALDGLAAYWWKGWRVESDVLTTEIARLDADGETEAILATLCREFPDDAKRAGIDIDLQSNAPTSPAAENNQAILDALHVAINKHPKGAKGKPDEIIKTAHVKRKQGRDCLRMLESRGEYAGFSRPRPRRYETNRSSVPER